MAKPPERTASDDSGERPPASADHQTAEADESLSVEELATVLHSIVLGGVDHATPTVLRTMLALSVVRDRARDDTDDALAAAARDLIRDGLTALGDGNYGRAARLVFGATDDTRGQPSRERRRMAADQIGVLPSWFSRRYLPDIRRDVAAEVLKIERAASDDGDSPAATDDPGAAVVQVIGDLADPASTAADPDGQRPRWRQLFGVRPRTDPGETGAQVALTEAHGLPGLAVQPRALTRALTTLRDEQRRRYWRVAAVALGGVVFMAWGLDAIPRYVLALTVLSVANVTAGMIREWRATRSLALGDHGPRLVASILVLAVAVAVVTEKDDPDAPRAAASDCEPWETPCVTQPGATTDGSGPSADSTSTTDAAHPSPNYTPTTYAVPPARSAPAECPPAGNTERRLSFDGVPPLCISQDSRITATIRTNYGHFIVELNTDGALYTVNNFVYLARWRFYDGVQLVPSPQPTEPTALLVDVWTHLLSTNPVANPATNGPASADQPTTTSDQRTTTTTTSQRQGAGVPGYTLTFENHQGAYPDDQTLYLVMADNRQPDQFAVIVTPEAHAQIAAANGAYPLLGVVGPECRDVFAQRDSRGGWDVSPNSETIVIESIDITEDPASTPATPVPDRDSCGQLAATQGGDQP